MLKPRSFAWLTLLFLPALPSAHSAHGADDARVAIKPVKFVGLEEAVKQQKGKVVLVDFWADYCVPCKKAFPRLVSLHQKYAKDGLAVVSVNIDDPGDAEARDKAVKFLEQNKAVFTNLFLAEGEKPEEWLERLKFDSIPCLFVFNKEGKLEKRFNEAEGPIDHAQVEKLLEQLLRK